MHSRRAFLRGLVGMSAAALAVKLSLPNVAMADEVREDLLKDLHAVEDRGAVSIVMPGKAFDTAPVYASVAGTAHYWAEEIRKDYLRVKGREIAAPVDAQLERMTRELARRIDGDIIAAMLPVEQQLLVGMPQWKETRWGGLEVAGGLQKRKTLFGEEWRVEYIKPTELVAPDGSKLSMDLQLDDKGMSEYGGLIVPA